MFDVDLDICWFMATYYSVSLPLESVAISFPWLYSCESDTPG